MSWKEEGYEALEWWAARFGRLTIEGAFVFGNEEKPWLKEHWLKSGEDEEEKACICLFWRTSNDIEGRAGHLKPVLGAENYEKIKEDLDIFIEHYND